MTKKLLAFAAITAMAFFTVSCGEEEHHDGDGHDHSNEGSGKKTTQVDSSYPLKTCVVSGEALGSMGDAVTLVHEGTTVKFCCDHCIPKFKKEPAKYLAKLK